MRISLDGLSRKTERSVRAERNTTVFTLMKADLNYLSDGAVDKYRIGGAAFALNEAPPIGISTGPACSYSAENVALHGALAHAVEVCSREDCTAKSVSFGTDSLSNLLVLEQGPARLHTLSDVLWPLIFALLALDLEVRFYFLFFSL